MERYLQSEIVFSDFSQFRKAYLVPLADFHEGARDADHEVSDGYIKWIAEKDEALTFLNGDMMNCSGKDTTPELFEDLITPDEAYDRLVCRLEPIKSKILFITLGGHEGAIFRKTGTDYMARLCHALRPDGIRETDHSQDIPYRPDGGMFAIKLAVGSRSTVFTGWATHGWGGARTIGAKVAKVQELTKVADVDMYILSHDHTEALHRLNTLSPPVRWDEDETDIVVKRKLLINTGGFVQYKGYIRKKGYAPQDLGTPRIRLELKRNSRGLYHKDLHASI